MNRVRNGAGRRMAIVGTLSLSALILAAAPALASRVATDPEPDMACQAEFGSGVVTTYATTVETPGDSTNWFVSVEFTLSGAEASCELTLVTHELPGASVSYPQTVFDWDGGVFGAGTHTLTAALPLEGGAPGCHAQYDFVFGPAIEELTFEDRYDQRQIRARIVGSEECPIVPTVVPTPTPGAGTGGGNPTPTPGEGTLGGNPTPTPAAALPDTSMPVSGTGPVVAAIVLLIGSLAPLHFARVPLNRRPR